MAIKHRCLTQEELGSMTIVRAKQLATQRHFCKTCQQASLFFLTRSKEKTSGLIRIIFGRVFSKSAELQPEQIKILVDKVARIIRAMPNNKREMVMCRYGARDGHVYSVTETSKLFNVTEDDIRRLEVGILKKIGAHALVTETS